MAFIVDGTGKIRSLGGDGSKRHVYGAKMWWRRRRGQKRLLIRSINPCVSEMRALSLSNRRGSVVARRFRASRGWSKGIIVLTKQWGWSKEWDEIGNSLGRFRLRPTSTVSRAEKADEISVVEPTQPLPSCSTIKNNWARTFVLSFVCLEGLGDHCKRVKRIGILVERKRRILVTFRKLRLLMSNMDFSILFMGLWTIGIPLRPSSGSIDGSLIGYLLQSLGSYNIVDNLLLVNRIPTTENKVTWPLDCRHSTVFGSLYLMFGRRRLSKRKWSSWKIWSHESFERTIVIQLRKELKQKQGGLWLESSRFIHGSQCGSLQWDGINLLPSRGRNVWATTRGSERRKKFIFISLTSLMRLDVEQYPKRF